MRKYLVVTSHKCFPVSLRAASGLHRSGSSSTVADFKAAHHFPMSQMSVLQLVASRRVQLANWTQLVDAPPRPSRQTVFLDGPEKRVPDTPIALKTVAV